MKIKKIVARVFIILFIVNSFPLSQISADDKYDEVIDVKIGEVKKIVFSGDIVSTVTIDSSNLDTSIAKVDNPGGFLDWGKVTISVLGVAEGTTEVTIERTWLHIYFGWWYTNN